MAGSADISRDRRHRASDASESFGEAAFVRTESTEHGPYYPFPQASNVSEAFLTAQPSPSQVREQEHRLEDDLAMLERLRGSFQIRTRLCSLPPLCASHGRGGQTTLMSSMPIRTLSTRRLQVTPPPAHPASNLAKVLKRIHDSSFIVRYFMYIIPVSALLSVPLLVGTLAYGTDAKSVGGVQLLWFSVWLEIVWLTLWASRVSHIPNCLVQSTLLTNPLRSPLKRYRGRLASFAPCLRTIARSGGIWASSSSYL